MATYQYEKRRWGLQNLKKNLKYWTLHYELPLKQAAGTKLTQMYS